MNSTRPLRFSSMPMMAFRVVDLLAPLQPIRATDFAAADFQVDVEQDVCGAVPGIQALDAQQHVRFRYAVASPARRCRPRRGRMARVLGTRPGPAGTTDARKSTPNRSTLLHRRVGTHLGCAAFGDQLAAAPAR